MERKARDMMNSIRKIVENWKLGASMMGLIVLLAILSTFALQSIQNKAIALEDIDWNNCDCDVDNSIVYSCYEEESEDA